MPIPSGALFDSATLLDESGQAGTCIAGTKSVVCLLSQLTSSTKANALVTLRFDPTQANTTMKLTATVGSQASDPVPANNQASVPTVVFAKK